MAEQQITGFPVRAAPNSRVTKDSETFVLLAVNATFDGSGASVDFLPAVELVSDAGVVVGRFKTDSAVSAGDSAEVTFGPFLRSNAGFSTAELETGKATWTPAEVLAGATKQLLPGVVGTVLYPLEVLMAVTLDFNPIWGAGQPEMTLDSSSGFWGWQTLLIGGGGSAGSWFSADAMIGSGNFTAPFTDVIQGDGMSATVQVNDLISVTTGHLSVFVTARRVVWP